MDAARSFRDLPIKPGGGRRRGAPCRLRFDIAWTQCRDSRALPRRRRVLSGQLRCRALELLLLPVQTSLPAPGALEVVPYVEAQPAELLGLDLDPITVLEAAQAAMVGAGRDDVTGLERVDRGDPLDAARDLVGHVARVVVLLEVPVHPQLYLKTMRIGDLVGRHDVGSDRAEGVARLHLVERVAARRQAAGGAVDEVRVAEDVAHRLVSADAGRLLADDQRDLGVALEHPELEVVEEKQLHGSPPDWSEARL